MKPLIVIDIETLPDQDFLLSAEAREVRERTIRVPANYKKQGAIDDYRNNQMEKTDKEGGLSALNGRVCAIGWKFLYSPEDGGTQCVCSVDPRRESTLLSDFFDSLPRETPHVVGGFAIKDFDLPFLLVRAAIHGIELPVWWPTLDMHRNVFDMNRLAMTVPGGKYRLDYWLHRFGIPVKSAPSGAEVVNMSEEEIEHYCMGDVDREADLIKPFWRVIPQGARLL